MEHSKAIDIIVGYLFHEPTAPKQYEAAAVHVAACSTCMDQLDATFGLFEEQRYTLGKFLVESGPPSPPVPTYSEFLREKEQVTKDVWKVTEKSRKLVHAIQIVLREQGNRFGEMDKALQRFQLAPIPVRGDHDVQREGLDIEDPDSDLCISLRLSSQNQISVQISSQTTSMPIPGRISLISSDEEGKILQRRTMEPGEIVSLPIGLGDMVIKIEHNSRIWQIPINVI